MAGPDLFARDITIGIHDDGSAAVVPFSATNLLIQGDSCTGKSHLAGLMVERWRQNDERILVIDLEGDHVGLGRFPDAVVIEGAFPTADALAALFRRLRIIVLDLSGTDLAGMPDRLERLGETVAWLRHSGSLALRVVIDEAHQLLGPGHVMADGLDRDDQGYTLVTYRPGSLPWVNLPRIDAVLTTRGTDGDGRRRSALIACEEKPPRSFLTAVRHSAHVRHWHKYADGQLPWAQWFRFTSPDGRHLGEATNLREFTAQVETLPPEVVGYHLARGDFASWFAGMKNDVLAQRAGSLAEAQRAGVEPAELQRRLVEDIRTGFGLGEGPAPEDDLSWSPVRPAEARG